MNNPKSAATSDSLRRDLIRSLQHAQSDALDLRLQVLGSRFEAAKLLEAGISPADGAPSDSYQTFLGYYEAIEDKFTGYIISLYLSPDGTALDLRIGGFEPTQTDRGIEEIDECPDSVRGGFLTSVALALTEPVPNTAVAEWAGITTDHADTIIHADDEIHNSVALITSLVAESTGRPFVTRQIIGLVRHLDQINCADCLGMAALTAAQFDLLHEAERLAGRALAIGDIEAETWTNLGCLYSDFFGLPELAIRCFRQAIAQNPDLMQPRQNLWFAGRNGIWSLLLNRKFEEAVKFSDLVVSESAIDAHTESHGFWGLLGLCHEGLGDIENARACYERGQHVDSDCYFSSTGLQRLSESNEAERVRAFDELMMGLQLQQG
jgi:tetratricopeptide (TPR) repeat protein